MGIQLREYPLIETESKIKHPGGKSNFYIDFSTSTHIRSSIMSLSQPSSYKKTLQYRKLSMYRNIVRFGFFLKPGPHQRPVVSGFSIQRWWRNRAGGVLIHTKIPVEKKNICELRASRREEDIVRQTPCGRGEQWCNCEYAVELFFLYFIFQYHDLHRKSEVPESHVTIGREHGSTQKRVFGVLSLRLFVENERVCERQVLVFAVLNVRSLH